MLCYEGIKATDGIEFAISWLWDGEISLDCSGGSNGATLDSHIRILVSERERQEYKSQRGCDDSSRGHSSIISVFKYGRGPWAKEDKTKK